MDMVQCLCPSCGEKLSFGNAIKIGICNYCGEPLVIHPALQSVTPKEAIEKALKARRMNIQEIINKCLLERKMNRSTLAKQMGFPFPSYVNNLVARGEGMAVGKMLRLMEELEYDVVIIDKKTRIEIGVLDLDK